jgi:hypothetical protein
MLLLPETPTFEHAASIAAGERLLKGARNLAPMPMAPICGRTGYEKNALPLVGAGLRSGSLVEGPNVGFPSR